MKLRRVFTIALALYLLLTLSTDAFAAYIVNIRHDHGEYSFVCYEDETIPMVHGSGLYFIGRYRITDQGYIYTGSDFVDYEAIEPSYTDDVLYTDIDYAEQVAEALYGDCVSSQDMYDRTIEYASNLRYDFEALDRLTDTNEHRVVVEDTLTSGKGICVDFSFAIASLLRSQDVPCKIVYGYADGIYHAWNMVLVDGEWLMLDPTCLAVGREFKEYTVYIEF